MRWLGLGLIAAEVVVVGLAFDPGAQPAFALPKSAASRALSYALALAVAAFLFRHPIARPAGPAWAALAAFLGLSAVATAVGLHPYTALYGAPDRLLGLSVLLEGALLALAVAVMVRGQRDALLLARALAVTAALIVLYALVQAAGRDPFRWAEGYLASTLGNTTVLGGYLATAAALLAATLASTWRGLGRAERVALALVAVLAAYIVADRGGRAATLGLLAGLACVPLIAFRGVAAKPRLRRRALLALGAAAGLSVAVAVVAAGPGAMERLERLVRPTDSSTTERVQIYRAALAAVAQHPLFGVGPDSFIAVYPSVRPLEVVAVSGPAQAQSSTHSWLLHHTVGSGLPGAAAIVAAALLALWHAWRAAPGRLAPTLGFVGLAAFLAHGLVSVSHIATESLFWLSLGLALAPRVELAVHPLPGEVGRRVARSEGSLHRAAAGERVALAAVLVAGTILATTTWAPVDASRAALASARLRAAGELDAADRAATEAIRLDKGRAAYWNELGLVHTRRSPIRAVAAFERATAAAPYEVVYLLNLASEGALLLDRDPSWKERSRELARRAAGADPNNAVAQHRAAEILWLLGDIGEAVERIERAIAVAPSPAQHYALAVDIYEAAGRHAEASERLERYIALTWPGGDAPLETRRRLGRLYHAAGDVEKISRILPPPRVVAVTVCSPSCFLVRFDSPEDLWTDGSRGSAANVTNYRLRGVPLPAGSTVEVREPLLFVVTVPTEVPPPAAGDRVEVAGVQDVYGRPIAPDPTTLLIQ